MFFAVDTIKRAPSLLFTIPKKGNLRFPKNWRGIQLAEFFNAWYDRIISNRIKLWMYVDELQTAYQTGKSCNTQIFTLRAITELAKKRKTPLFVLFLDLEKAFDLVRRVTMLKVLMQQGMGSNMLYALKKNLYSNTKVVLDKIGTFTSTSGIRQGAASSAYIFIIFVNGLFQYLRSIYGVNFILGKIHNLIHADDTIILATSYDVFKRKISSTVQFFDSIDQKVNLGKTKYMCIDSQNRHLKQDLVTNNFIVEYSTQEKYLGHYVTDENSLRISIELDIQERAANVLVKLRNFINNNKNTTLEIRLKVFQACFCSSILNNCETWGQWIPKTVKSLYNQGLKLALEVRNSTPTALVYLETRQPSITALIRKRQHKFWTTLNKYIGTEICELIKRADKTLYITHYK